MAGPLAEERLTGVALEQQTGADTNKRMAREGNGGRRVDIKSVLPFCRQMVEHEWPAIQLFAGELVRQHELDYDEVRSIIAAA
jgi:hypothetical protein